MAAQLEGPACTPSGGPRRGAPPTCPGQQHILGFPSSAHSNTPRGLLNVTSSFSPTSYPNRHTSSHLRCPAAPQTASGAAPAAAPPAALCCRLCSPPSTSLTAAAAAAPCPGVAAAAAASNRCWCSTTAAWAPAACRSRRPATPPRSWRRTPWRSWYGIPYTRTTCRRTALHVSHVALLTRLPPPVTPNPPCAAARHCDRGPARTVPPQLPAWAITALCPTIPCC